MESFLSGRATVAKLKPAETRTTAGTSGFSPMFEKKAEPLAVPAFDAPPSPLPSQTAAPLAEAPPHTHKVSVEVVRVDGAVQGIVVTCKCGERIELDCVY